jgi:hypothetical protein
LKGKAAIFVAAFLIGPSVHRAIGHRENCQKIQIEKPVSTIFNPGDLW